MYGIASISEDKAGNPTTCPNQPISTPVHMYATASHECAERDWQSLERITRKIVSFLNTQNIPIRTRQSLVLIVIRVLCIGPTALPSASICVASFSKISRGWTFSPASGCVVITH